MKTSVGYVVLGIASLILWMGTGCPDPTSRGAADQNTEAAHSTTLKITLSNNSCGTYLAAKFGVCPNGLSEEPHYFVDPPAVLAPGQSVTYTTDQLAGATDGDCVAFPTAFMVGLPGWGYGPTSNPDAMTYVDTCVAGLIGVQFHCGDTITLRWTNCDSGGGGAGQWTTEVIPGPGNAAPTVPFGPLS